MGHPEIITERFNDIENYFGLIKCKVLPPRGLYLPVLPYRSHNKLMFPLCKTCVESMQQSSCHHTNEERSIIGTWVSEEVKLAIKQGYQVTEVLIYFHNSDTDFFFFLAYLFLNIYTFFFFLIDI